jgi:hypothetical protein
VAVTARSVDRLRNQVLLAGVTVARWAVFGLIGLLGLIALVLITSVVGELL